MIKPIGKLFYFNILFVRYFVVLKADRVFLKPLELVCGKYFGRIWRISLEKP
jgi:hypothetical protein